MNINRLQEQLQFLQEIDKLKAVLRKSQIGDCSRLENSAEHSWHVAIMALVLSEYANERIDILKTVKMLLIHDIVEIDTGDTSLYSSARASQAEKEKKAAERIFGILPDDSRSELLDLWVEFEGKKTPESKFAAAVDRLEPLLRNYYSEGYTWKKFNITAKKVIAANQHIRDGSEHLWEFATELIGRSVEKGYLMEEENAAIQI